MPVELIDVIAKYDNICNYLHLPVQTGSDKILKKMNRKYNAEHYLNLISQIKERIPDCAISTDIIAGYPSETLEDHEATLDIIKKVRFSNAFMFRYSPREGTKAFKDIDDVPEEEKIRRLNEIIHRQNKISKEENQKDIGKIFEVLVEKPSKKNPTQSFGRTKTNKLVVFERSEDYTEGDIIRVEIMNVTSATLKGNKI